ncbi:transposase, IS4 family protein [Candidatus Magnetoovum chiemensis]|nr:transposase, IS4 family protein [Candidatus Magnetoovum chiemensis]
MGEKDDALYTYKGNKGYMPLLGFLYEGGMCINDDFRDGNVSPAFGHRDFYIKCKDRMPLCKRIGYYRADSASYQADLINDLEADNVIFGITADMDKAVKRLVESIKEQDWIEPINGCGYKVADTVHTMDRTSKAFRLVIKREGRQVGLFEDDKEEKYFYHAIATNWLAEEKDAHSVLKWHNQRGEAENFNKELKIGFAMERMPCGQTSANAVFFRIGVIAYNLFLGFRRLSSPQSWQRHRIGTFRWKLLQIAGRIVRHAGNVILKLAVKLKELNLFKGIRKKTYEFCSCSTV